ncbi:MAG: pas, partial [uncultured bacterium]
MNSGLFAWLRLFLPVALLIGLGGYFYIDNQQTARLTALQADESLNVGLGAAMLDRRTLVLLQDLRYQVRINTISADNRAVPDSSLIARHFVELLHSKPVYDELRWIDTNGQELVRVELEGGQPVVVAQERLQNKADRYYFAEAMKLAPGEVYISPVDLKVENRGIVVPYKRNLRLAMPLVGNAGDKYGILVFNYHVDEMIAYMEAVTKPVADHLVLLNGAGDFLHSPNSEDERGFIENNKQQGLPARFPASWARLIAKDYGQFIDAQGLWTFQAVYPLRVGSPNISTIRANEQTGLADAASVHRWLVVSLL